MKPFRDRDRIHRHVDPSRERAWRGSRREFEERLGEQYPSMVSTGQNRAFLDALVELGIVPEDVPHIHRASSVQIYDKLVIGELPMHLAWHARDVLQVDVQNIGLMRKDMDLDDVMNLYYGLSLYHVSREQVRFTDDE